MDVTGLLKSQDTAAVVELAVAAHCRISAAGVSDALTDRTDLRRLNPHSDLSPARMPAAMKRLFMDPEGSFRRALERAPIGVLKLSTAWPISRA